MTSYYPSIMIPKSFTNALSSEIEIPPLKDEPINPKVDKEKQLKTAKNSGNGCVISLIIFLLVIGLSFLRLDPRVLDFVMGTTTGAIVGHIFKFLAVVSFIGMLIFNSIETVAYDKLKKQTEYEKLSKEIYWENSKTMALSYSKDTINEKLRKEKLDAILKYNIEGIQFHDLGDNVIKGKSEIYFQEYLTAFFSNRILLGNISLYAYHSKNLNKSVYYTPDFIYMNSKTKLKICIEIDEPYILGTNEPIHFLVEPSFFTKFKGIEISSSDSERDYFFLESNWIIIRFAEEQVIKYPYECCRVVQNIESKIASYKQIDKYDYSFLPKIKRWNYNEALSMAQNFYRNQYLLI